MEQTNRTLEQIQAELEEARDAYDAKFNDVGNTSRSWEDFLKWSEPERKKMAELSRELRMMMPYKLTPIPDYADVMPLKEFVNACQEGWFIDYDGYGQYIFEGQETDIEIYPSDIHHNAVRWEFSEVAWYNR